MMSLVRRLSGYLPRSWRIALLRELAWPEFEVRRQWLVSDPDSPSGVRMTHIALEDALSAEGLGRLMLRAAVANAPLNAGDHAQSGARGISGAYEANQWGRAH